MNYSFRTLILKTSSSSQNASATSKLFLQIILIISDIINDVLRCLLTTGQMAERPILNVCIQVD